MLALRDAGAVVLAAVVRRALAPLAPPSCFGCGAGAGAAEPLCPSCRGSLTWLDAEPLVLEAGPRGRVEAWAPLAYRGGAQALVRGLKFRGALSLAEPMAATVAANAPAGLLDGRALVPVPLHPSRRRRRGFNQAAQLALALAQRTDGQVADCLERRGSRGTQMGRDRDERLRALEGAIGLGNGQACPQAAVIVDDVLTTGATALACARALRAAGCEDMAAIAYARTPGR